MVNLPERKLETADERWARMPTIVTGDDYVNSLRNRGTRLYFMGKKIDEPTDHPVIRPSINALKMTYDLAIADPELGAIRVPSVRTVVVLPAPFGPRKPNTSP